MKWKMKRSLEKEVEGEREMKDNGKWYFRNIWKILNFFLKKHPLSGSLKNILSILIFFLKYH